ncbi:MAG: caspase family protein [Saprospiraceae bacterium]
MNKVYVLSITLLLFSINWASAQCVSGNCISGSGTWKWDSGAVYTGEFQNGTRSGYGQYTFLNGDIYVGEWQNNQKHGYGVYYFNGNSNYKERYAGEWIADKRSGMGIMYYKDKDIMPRFGLWKDNKFSKKYEDLGCLEGDCYQNFGLYVWDDGSRYEGNFKNGERHGEGIYYYSKGGKYVGHQSTGKRHGWGTYHYPSGSKYVGEWKQEVKEGNGSMYSKGKLIAQGEWKNNELIKQAITKTSTDETPPVITILTPAVQTLRNGGIKIVVKDRIIQVEGVASDENGIARVRTNGSISELTDIDKTKKRFIGEIVLAKGQNQFWVEAEDKAGNKTKEQYEIEYKTTDNTVTKTPTISEKRTALIIGNAHYSSVQALRNPENDAVAMANRLQELDFEVELKTNISQKEMKIAIADYGERLKANGGVGLFYYAGHGLQVSGQNYLVPIDADIRRTSDIELEAVDLKRLLNEIEFADNRLNIVILDACRDNPYGGDVVRGMNNPNGLSTTDAPSGTYIAYSTAPNKAASDGSGEHGLYTEMLLRALESPKGKDLEDVFKEVRRYVIEESEGLQKPWDNSSLLGDFYFKQ